MRRALLCLSAVVLFAPCYAAAAVPATQPAADELRAVLVLPFASPAGGLDWIGKGAQQDLSASLAEKVRGRVLAPASAPPAADAEAAIKTARDLGASVVVFGQAQVLKEQVRLSGQVLDVASGKAYGSLRATGTIDDLFQLEDALAGQISAVLPRAMLTLRGLTAANRSGLGRLTYGQRATEPPPAELPTGELSNGSFLSPVYAPPASYGVPETFSPPPYESPYMGSYPYSFYYPYAPLFTYGAAPDWFFIVPGFGRHHHFDQDDFRGSRDGFGQHAGGRMPMGGFDGGARMPMGNFRGGGGAPMGGLHGGGHGRR